MKRTKNLLFAAAIIMVLAATAFATVNITEGSWEMTAVTEMKGMPFKIPPIKYTVCLTKDNLNPQKQEKSQDCTIISQKTVGNTYSWVSECNTKEGLVKSNGSITYKGSTLDGVINVTTKGTVMSQTLSGRRTGACAK